MSLFDNDESAWRLPVAVITGFLGSGKTTLLNGLLKHPDTGDAAVIVNEFGEVAIDHLLVEAVEGETMVLASGCVCCALRDDLVTALRQLYARRASGDLPAFQRVIIETTGLADPAPIAQMLLNNPMVSSYFRLDSVVTTVDALHGIDQLEAQPEAVKQVALADRLLLTKGDIATPEAIERLHGRLRALNRLAELHEVVKGAIAPDALFGAEPATRRWLGDQWLTESSERRSYDGHLHGGHHHEQQDIESFVLEFEEPLEWRLFSRWLGDLRGRCGEQLLRVKGVLALRGEEQPVVIQGVHHVFHPPVRLEAWPESWSESRPDRAPDGSRRSRIVFITRALPRDLVEESWHDYLTAAVS